MEKNKERSEARCLPIHIHSHTVRFNEVDAAGIVFFARFFEWAHHAWEDLLSRAFGSWFETMQQMGIGLPLAGANARFRRPARLGEVIFVRATLQGSAPRRLTVLFVLSTEDGAEIAQIQHEHAFVDLATFRPTNPPDGFVEAMVAAGLATAGEHIIGSPP